MAPKKTRPGERRRRKLRSKRHETKKSFVRPREWAEQELIGVRVWLKRLKGPEGWEFPTGWRRGQIKHYEKRARFLVTEIQASKDAEKAVESGPDVPPKVA